MERYRVNEYKDNNTRLKISACSQIINQQLQNQKDRQQPISKMIKKLSKSRKKKTASKLANSRTKPLKQVYTYKEHKQTKQYKNSNKNNHQSSTLSLLSNHNHQASQCSLYEDHKSKKKPKNININRDSSVSSIVKDGKIKDREKEKQKYKQKEKERDRDKVSKQIKKSKKLSSLNPNSKNKGSSSKLSPQRAQKNDKAAKGLKEKEKQKQIASKKNKKSRQEEIYERINLGLYNSKTNSQINFSNNSSVRQNNASQLTSINNVSSNLSSANQSKNKKFLTIDCSDQYILNQYFNNSKIKNHERKRSQAAIKIQKVFRGYLTRKMLQQYIIKQEQRLNQLSRKIIQSRKQSANFGSVPNSRELSYVQSQKDQREREERILILSKNKLSEDIFLENSPDQRKEMPRHAEEKAKVKNYNNAKPGEQVQISLQLKNSLRQVQHPILHDSLDEQSSIYAQPQQITNQSNLINDQSQIFDQYSDFQGPSYELKVNQQRLKKDQKQISQQFLKYTPSSSLAPISKSKFDQPIPTDFSEKRVSQLEPEISNKSRDMSVGNNRKMYKNVNEFSNNSPQIKSEQRESQVVNLPKKVQQKNIRQERDRIMTNKNMPRIADKTEKSIEDKEKKLISILKKDEKEKWEKVIKMLSHQIEESKEKSLDSQKFMSAILEFSKKNKEQLEKSNIMSFEKTISFEVQEKESQQFSQSLDFLKDNVQYQRQIGRTKQERSINTDGQNKDRDFYFIRKRNKLESSDKYKQQLQKSMPSHERQFEILENELKIAKQQIKITQEKNMDLPLLNKKYQHGNINMLKGSYTNSDQIKQNCLFDKTEKLKDFYRKNCQVYPIEQMIKVRQKALEKRQKQQLNRLNEDLFHQKLKHDQFLRRLSDMQQKFQQQRRYINKAKMEIFIGYRATHKLIQDSVKDAWYLGFKIPLTQSLKDFKKMHTNSIWIKEIIVDQLKFYSASNQNSSKMTTSQIINIQNQDLSHKNDQKSNNPLFEQNRMYEGIFENQSHQQSDSKYSSSVDKFSYEASGQKKKQDISLSINQDESSLTIKPNNELSQQSFSEEISYNEGEVEAIHLVQDYSQKIEGEEQENSSQDVNDEFELREELKGFKKIDHSKFTEKVPIKLAIDKKNHLQDIETMPNPKLFSNRSKVGRKISLNQKSSDKYAEFKEIHKYQMTPRNSKGLIKPKSQIYCLEIQSSSEQQEYKQDQVILKEQQQFDQDIKELTEQILITVIWQAIGQIYNFNSSKMKFMKFPNKQPAIISDHDRNTFIKILIQYMPKFQVLKPRINQKMMASRIEILKFMRVSFDDQSLQKQMSDFIEESLEKSSSSQSYEQIGKYQHILPAIACIKALDRYLEQQESAKSYHQQTLQHLEMVEKQVKEQYRQKVSYETLKKVIQRQKVLIFNKKQRKDLGRQIKKVQFHCIFDSLNQIIMKKRLRISGYSGIGLNQLSLITRTEVFRQIQHQKQFVAILSESVKQVEDLVSSAKTSGQKLLMQNYQKLCQNDSQWIYYTDQALSFALQFVYMLEDEIFYEQTAQIFKRNFKL